METATRDDATGPSAERPSRSAHPRGSGRLPFVAPQFLTENYGLYRTYGPAFLDQSRRLQYRGWGLEFQCSLAR